MGGTFRHVGRIVISAIAVVACLAPAAPVSAAQAVRGYTQFHDGELYKTGPIGTVVSVFATSAPVNTSFKLRMAPAEQEETCPDVGAVDLNPNVRYSNSRGFIATTSGVANQPVGEYEICFYQIPLDALGRRVATLPVFLAIV